MGLWGGNIQEDFLKKSKQCQAKKSSLDQYVDRFAALGVTSLIYTGPDCPLDFLHLLNLTIVNLSEADIISFAKYYYKHNNTSKIFFKRVFLLYFFFFKKVSQYEKGFSNISYKNSFPYFIYVSFT